MLCQSGFMHTVPVYLTPHQLTRLIDAVDVAYHSGDSELSHEAFTELYDTLVETAVRFSDLPAAA